MRKANPVKISISILGTFLVLFLLSCTTHHRMSIDVLEPAKVSVPFSYGKIAIVLSLPDDKEKSNIDLAALNQELVAGLSDIMQYSPVFLIDTVLFVPNRVTYNELQRVMDDHAPDDTLSYLFIQPTALSDTFYQKYIQEYGGFLINYYYMNEVSYILLDGVSYKQLDAHIIRDTLVEQYYLNNPGNVKPDMSFHYTLARKNSESYAHRIAPRWIASNRYIYASGGGNLELIRGYRKVKKGRMEEAVALWEKALNNSDPLVVARASYNIAVYYEIQDDLDMALEFAAKAFNTDQSGFFQNYLTLLEHRIQQKERLMQQLQW